MEKKVAFVFKQRLQNFNFKKTS